MTDYQAIQKKRNIVVGGFVIIASLALLWMIMMFGELPVMATEYKSFKIKVQFPSSYGIMEKTPVYYLGYPVGKVINVSPPKPVPTPPPDGPVTHQIVTKLAINKNFNKIPSNVKIKVMKKSMGSSFVELFPPKDPADTYLKEGLDRIQGSVGSTNEFIPEEFQTKLEELVVKMTSLAESVDSIVGDQENQRHIKQTLTNLTNVSRQAAETLQSISKFTDAGTETLNETSESINDSLKLINDIMQKANEGKGSLGKFLNDGRLYENLLESSKELQLLMEELKILTAETREKGIKIKL